MKTRKRTFIALFTLLAITLLVASPILSFDKPTKPTPPGNNGQHGNPPDQQATDPAPTEASVDTGSSDPISTPAPLGCQKNNPDRLDCSSLDVGGYCEGSVAVFTIHNGGEPGNGDMLASTAYRLVVDGNVVQIGSVQLAGGDTMEVRYEGSGTVTLEADQQVGHPGNSHPRVTLNCGGSDVTPSPTDTPTEEPTVTDTPTEEPTVEAPVLNAEAICWPDGSTAFLISNSGGDMTSAEAYTVTDELNNIVDQGSVQLYAGESTTLLYPPGMGTLLLAIGDLLVYNNPTGCVPEPTQEVTPPPETPILSADALCYLDGTTAFVITNSGSDMLAPVGYTVVDGDLNLVDQGSIQLVAGESITLSYGPYSGTLSLTVDGNLAFAAVDCASATPEVTPPPDYPSLTVDASCWADGSLAFLISNNGADMTDPASYVVVQPDGTLVDQGDLLLLSGETTTLVYPGYQTLTLMVGGGLAFSVLDCPVTTPEVTPEPTQEITPEPTVEVTPEPTVEVTPEPAVEVTPEPTDVPPVTSTLPPLGCQKNNPDRLDCSSLQVSGTCEGGVAVFTIRNTGKSGEGDMVAGTEYRIIVDGVVVESGTVQLTGGATTQITYSGGGTVTLEADQQVGHPGESQPQATLTCSG